METVRADIKRLIGTLQQYAPSQLNPRLVEFAMKESGRIAAGKETEMDEGQGEDDEEGEEQEEDGQAADAG